MAQHPVVPVGPFAVADLTRTDLVEHTADLSAQALRDGRPVLAYALHVGGLNAHRRPDFTAAMASADVVYADGGSVVWLARRAGAVAIERAPTTDVGWELLDALAARLGRAPRVALVGGPEGLTERVAAEMTARGSATVVLTDHGYHQDWSGPLTCLAAAAPEVTVVGLGAPREMVWCEEHRAQLPAGLVLTCGGWFGHIAGDEQRAPRLLRRSGLEWIARVAQSPRRLGPRYLQGALVTLLLALRTRRSGRPR